MLFRSPDYQGRALLYQRLLLTTDAYLKLNLSYMLNKSFEESNLSKVFIGELSKNGLLTVPAGPDVIRWLPPLNVQKSEVKEAIQIMISTLDKEAK